MNYFYYLLLTFVIQCATLEVQIEYNVKEVLFMASSIIQFRIDDDLKTEATAIYEKLGIDLSTAVRMFLKRSVMENGIPFPMTLKKEESAVYALQALKELNAEAANNGLSDMSLDEINAEIAAYRKSRKADQR